MPGGSSSYLPHQRCEVAIVGGGISGSALALLLRRRLRGARLLLVEQQGELEPAGGEVASGLGGLFLAKTLGLDDLLGSEHLPCHGSRFWFADGDPAPLEALSEVGTSTVPDLPAFLVDRARLAESMLALAAEEGVALVRPARVAAIEPGWPWSRFVVETGEGRHAAEARWIVDAGGAGAKLARLLGHHRRLDRTPLEQCEARWTGVGDLAGRSLGALHFCGRGWCARSTTLGRRRSAVALAFDPDRFEPPTGDGPLESYCRFVRSRPGLRELLGGARLEPESFAARSVPHWFSTACCGPGWFLVGDAAGSGDPLFAAPLDQVADTVRAAARIIGGDLRGDLDERALELATARHAPSGRRGCARALDGRGLLDYELLGDAQATAAAFFLDSAFDGLGLARRLRRDPRGEGEGVGSTVWSDTVRGCLRHRLGGLARRRRLSGLYGRRNRGWRRSARTGSLPPTLLGTLWAGLSTWLALEVEDFRERFTPCEGDDRTPTTEILLRYASERGPAVQALRRS